MKRKKTVTQLTMSALFAALTAVTTAYIFHIPMAVFGGQGYVHIGDAVIFLCAGLLPAPYACAAAAIGGTLADVLSGAALWAPFTFIIKAAVALCFTAKKPHILCKRNFLALIAACLITVAGYYLAEGILYSNFVTPVYSITGNVIQSVASAVLYLVLALALDKMKLKAQLSV